MSVLLIMVAVITIVVILLVVILANVMMDLHQQTMENNVLVSGCRKVVTGSTTVFKTLMSVFLLMEDVSKFV